MVPRKTGLLRIAIVVILLSMGVGDAARANFIYEVDLTGWETYSDFTSSQNSSVQINVFPFARISAVEWIDLEFVTDNGSFLDEFVISLSDSDNLNFFWDDRPEPLLSQSGTYQGSGSFSNPAFFGSGPFHLLADGILRIQVYETFDDFGSDRESIRDAFVTQGTLRITATAVPEPGSLWFVVSPLLVFVVANFGKIKEKCLTCLESSS